MPAFPHAPIGIFELDGNKPVSHGYGINTGDPLADGLIAYWPMWEAAGSQAQDVADGGGALTGTFSGPTWATSAPQGRWPGGPAVQFSGDPAYIPANGILRFPDPNKVTIAAWIRLPAAEERQTILGHNDENNSIQLEVNTSVGAGRISAIEPGTFIARSDPFVYPAAGLPEWMHVAYTRNGDGGGNHIVYLNAQPLTLASESANNFSQPAVNAEIGRRAAGSQFAIGLIGAVYVWGRALRQSQLQSLFEKPFDFITPGSQDVSGIEVAAAVGNPWYQYAQEQAVAG